MEFTPSASTGDLPIWLPCCGCVAPLRALDALFGMARVYNETVGAPGYAAACGPPTAWNRFGEPQPISCEMLHHLRVPQCPNEACGAPIRTLRRYHRITTVTALLSVTLQQVPEYTRLNNALRDASTVVPELRSWMNRVPTDCALAGRREADLIAKLLRRVECPTWFAASLRRTSRSVHRAQAFCTTAAPRMLQAMFTTLGGHGSLGLPRFDLILELTACTHSIRMMQPGLWLALGSAQYALCLDICRQSSATVHQKLRVIDAIRTFDSGVVARVGEGDESALSIDHDAKHHFEMVLAMAEKVLELCASEDAMLVHSGRQMFHPAWACLRAGRAVLQECDLPMTVTQQHIDHAVETRFTKLSVTELVIASFNPAGDTPRPV